MKIKFKKTHPGAQIPTRGSEFAACWDLYAPYDFSIPPSYRDTEHVYHSFIDSYIDLERIRHPVTTIDLGIAIELEIEDEFDRYEYGETWIKPIFRKGSYVTKIYSRSSMGKKGILIPNSVGIIDSDYRDSLKAMFINLSGKVYEIKAGDRIAQLMVQRYEPLEFEEVSELSPTKRDLGGLGSTGK